ncbi:anti-sigma factor family protein [Geopsychrobacter electrodiphilus]|uniref:anti-sigma factor family protein n=1 Tax=Geopsychrobacter electrodiphilus TaxID=225196 RepID=UPI00036E3D84|nr:zf-HC2 domain-containing protein [Geopsychrobacter electrodiphilus]
MTSKTQLNACPTEQLSLFHFGDLDDADKLQVEQHLQTCSLCRSELAEIRKFLNLVPTGVPELTDGELTNFSARVMKKLPQRRRFSRPALGWALAGALVMTLTLNLRQQIEPPVPVVTTQVAEQEVLDQFELLQNLDLLENLDLLQQLASQG